MKTLKGCRKVDIGKLVTLEEKNGEWYVNGNPVICIIDMGRRTLVFTANETFISPRFKHEWRTK